MPPSSSRLAISIYWRGRSVRGRHRRLPWPEKVVVFEKAFNTNGDAFRCRRMWREIGEYFGLEVADCPETPQPLEEQMAGVESTWRKIAEKHALVEPDVGKLASWWHTDADLGRDQECVNDTTKSRDFGFDHFRETRGAFLTCSIVYAPRSSSPEIRKRIDK